MPVRRPLDLRAIGGVLVLCVVWGIQQVALKGVAANAAPVMQLAIRFGGASIFFGLWVFSSEGNRAFTDGTLPSGLLLGLLFSLEFIFAGQALVHTTAAHSVVFLYTAPIFTALGLQFLPEERLSRLQWAGIGVAFLGIVIAFLGFSGRPVVELLTGDLLALLGGVCWGVSNVVLRRGRVGGARTAKTVLYQVATATIVLGAFAVATGQSQVELSTMTTLALLFSNAGHRNCELPRLVLVAATLSDVTSHAAIAADTAVWCVVRGGAVGRSHRFALHGRRPVGARGGADREFSTDRAAPIAWRIRWLGVIVMAPFRFEFSPASYLERQGEAIHELY